MSFNQCEYASQIVVVLDISSHVESFFSTVWGLNDNHWDHHEVFKLIFDAITTYGHLRPENQVMDIRFNYDIEITEELYDDAQLMQQASNALGLVILQQIKRLGFPINGIKEYVYAGLVSRDIVMEVRN